MIELCYWYRIDLNGTILHNKTTTLLPPTAGAVPEGRDWLDLVKPILEKRMQK